MSELVTKSATSTSARVRLLALLALLAEAKVTLVYDGDGPATAQVDGGLDWRALQQVLEPARSQLGRCYTADLQGCLAAAELIRQISGGKSRPALSEGVRGGSLEARLTLIDAVGVVYRATQEALGPDWPRYDAARLGGHASRVAFGSAVVGAVVRARARRGFQGFSGF